MILFDDEEGHVSSDECEDDINTLFMLNEPGIFKDGKGITHQVTYLRPHIIAKVLKHKICTKNETELFVDSILLSSLNAPGISTNPVTVEQYVKELSKLISQQIEHISHTEILDDEQGEFMGLYFKMNHVPFLVMITLSEQKRINKIFTQPK